MSEGMIRKRLYRSRVNRMIAGVCGGVGEYLGVDPTVVRVIWALSIFLGGTGILLYIVAVVVMPTNPDQVTSGERVERSGNIWAWALVVVGAMLLAHNLDIMPFFYWWGASSWKLIAALLLIILGVSFLFPHLRQTASAGTSQAEPREGIRPRLHRSIGDRKIFGVCGGLSEYFDVDSSLVRLVFVFITLASLGFGLLLYVILALVVPEEHLSAKSA